MGFRKVRKVQKLFSEARKVRKLFGPERGFRTFPNGGFRNGRTFRNFPRNTRSKNEFDDSLEKPHPEFSEELWGSPFRKVGSGKSGKPGKLGKSIPQKCFPDFPDFPKPISGPPFQYLLFEVDRGGTKLHCRG